MIADKNVWPGLMRSYDVATGQIITGDACDMFVARLYLDKFSKHARGDNNLAEVLRSIQVRFLYV